MSAEIFGTCHASSLSAGEALGGTATQAGRWLLIEAPGGWGRDVESTELPAEARAAAGRFDGRVQLLRRPGRRGAGGAAFVAESRPEGSTLRAFDPLDDLGGGRPLDGRLVLVCCHGRRDACCARLGTPVFDALRGLVPAGRLWQTSHVGGHRFAANVLVLPEGIMLGRVGPADAGSVAAAIESGRIPLAHYRGRTIDGAEAQAADAAVRKALGLDGLADVAVLGAADGQVRLATPGGVVEAVVETLPGPPLSESCGKAPAPSVRYNVRW